MLLLYVIQQAAPHKLHLSDLYDQWSDDIANWMRHDALKLLLILFIAFILLRILALVAGRLEKMSHHHPATGGFRGQQLRTLSSVVTSVGAVIIYLLALLQLLPLFGVDVKPILASAGIVGLAVGFGAQTFVKDVITGFFILIENQYDISDVIRIAGVTGTVEQMTLRKTVLRDANGTVHTVPSSEIKVVSNMTRDWAQVSLNVAVHYNEPSDKVQKLLGEVGAEIYNDAELRELLVAEPEVHGIERVLGQEVDYLVTAKVRPGHQYRLGRELRRRIKECFIKNGVKTPGPAKVYVADSTRPENS
jgi:small-conductance mechanosensitive channel